MTYYSTLVDDNNTSPCYCDNCDWRGPANATQPIRDLDQRIAPGEFVPVGECPECGCLAQLEDPVKNNGPLAIKLNNEYNAGLRERIFKALYKINWA